MPSVTVRQGTGVIDVTGAPVASPLPRDYAVAFGMILLSPELAAQAAEYGWVAIGEMEGLTIVQRNELTYARLSNVVPDL